MTDEKRLFLRGEISGRALGIFEKEVADPAGGKFFELQQERRGEIKRRAGVGKFVEQEGHIVIGLRGMQPDPGHTGGARDRVRVVRLVHVPEEAELNGFHQEVSCSLAGSMS